MSKIYRQHIHHVVLRSPEYLKHIDRMTAENLHGKSDIACELAARDIRIEELEAQLAEKDAEIATLREALKNAAAACRNLEYDERFTGESIAKGCEKALAGEEE